jgi:hypothetical protein
VEAERIAPGLWRLEKRHDWGWSVGMLLAELPGGGLLVHSPTWCGEGTFEAVEKIGEVRAIVAPNHFHHLSLARFRERYPRAVAVCSDAARPRLEKQGHRELRTLADLELPDGARAIANEHTKNGEAWLVWPGGTLIACDSFFHVPRAVTGGKGWVLRRMKIAPGLSFGWTFKYLCLTSRPKYRDWASGMLREIAPRRLAVSHGDVLEDDALGERMCDVLAARLR